MIIYLPLSKYICYNLLRKGCAYMGLAEFERRKDEKNNGVVYDMSPAPGHHGYM